jgi:hypothetical protein
VPNPAEVRAAGERVAKLRCPPAGSASPATVSILVILSFCVSRGCDLRRPVVDSVLDGTAAA